MKVVDEQCRTKREFVISSEWQRKHVGNKKIINSLTHKENAKIILIGSSVPPSITTLNTLTSAHNLIYTNLLIKFSRFNVIVYMKQIILAKKTTNWWLMVKFI